MDDEDFSSIRPGQGATHVIPHAAFTTHLDVSLQLDAALFLTLRWL
jgi:hypothetical protein